MDRSVFISAGGFGGGDGTEIFSVNVYCVALPPDGGVYYKSPPFTIKQGNLTQVEAIQPIMPVRTPY